MKIGLFGHGKMGKELAKLAPSFGHQIVDVEDADVCIDFSHASIVLEHIKWAAKSKKSLVIGTTGWENDLAEAQQIAAESSIGVIAAPNFSLGVAKFLFLLKQSRRLLSDYAIAGVEFHHSQKQDAPSGTAKAIGEALELSVPFASVRIGNEPGKHMVIFDSAEDKMTFTHEAHNREGFARGALQAASWILNKKGWFTLDEMFRNVYSACHALQ